MKYIILFIVALASLGFQSDLHAQAGIYIHFEGIDGESQDVNHQHKNKFSDVISVHREVGRPYVHTGSSGNFGNIEQGLHTVEMKRDKSWVNILERLNTGAPTPKVTIDHVRSAASPAGVIYLKTELTNVFIESVDYGDDPELIQVTFKAEKIKDTYTIQNAQGGTAGTVDFEFDYTTNN